MPEFGWGVLNEDDKEIILKGMDRGRAFAYPKTVEIDWTDRCNLNCIFCSQKPMLAGDELDLPTLERAFTSMDKMGVSSLQVSGGGDPLFHRDILKILEAIPRHTFKISTITTNGLLLTEAVAERLLAVTRDQITISLNAFGEEEYERMMMVPGKNYGRVLQNVRDLVALKRAQSRFNPQIALQFFLYNANYNRLSEMFELAESLGVDTISFNPIFLHDELSSELEGKKDEILNGVRNLLKADRDNRITDILTISPQMNRAIETMRREEFHDDYPRACMIHENYNNLNGLCPMPWFLMHVKATGAVYPCCALLVPEFRPLGNIHDKTLEAIWRNRKYRRFRKSMTKLIHAFREGDEALIESVAIPHQCKTHGMCIIKSFPYLDDRPFYIKGDALSRAPRGKAVLFPDHLEDDKPAVITGTMGRKDAPGGKVEITINRVHGGVSNLKEGKFSFEFLPNPLTKGWNLLQVHTMTGDVLAARFIEKV